MLNSLKGLAPKAWGFARQMPQKATLNPYFNQQPVSQVAVRQPYTAQQGGYSSSLERNRFISHADLKQGTTPLAVNVQRGIRNRIQHLFKDAPPAITPIAPSSSRIAQPSQVNSAASTAGPIQQAITSQHITARADHLVDDPELALAIENSQKTLQQENRKRAAEAQTRADALDPQLQRDMALAIQQSMKTHQVEKSRRSAKAIPQTQVSNASRTPLSQVLTQSNLEYFQEQEAIAFQKSTVANMLGRYGYRFRDVPRDGNCFYHALAAHYSERVTVEVMRKAIAEEAWRFFEQYLRGERPFPGYDEDLYKRLLGERDLYRMFGRGHYGDITDIIFAARRLQRPIMVINRLGSSCLTVDRQGSPLLWVNSLADASRLSSPPIVMVWDPTIENKPGSNHFMLATR